MPSLSTLVPVCLAICGAWLGFPNPLVQLPLTVLLLPACLSLLAAQAPGPGAAFRHGLLTGGGAFAACLYWVALPVHDYAYLPWALAAPCPMLLGLVLGLYSGLFCMLLSLTEGRLPWLLQALFAGLLWGALEWLRGIAFTGFPWLGLASAFSYWPMMIQGAAIVGAYGLAAYLAFAASLLARFAIPNTAHGQPLFLGLTLLVLLPVHGHYTLARPLQPDGSAMIGLVQGNIDQGVKWDAEFQTATVDRYITMTDSLVMRQKPMQLDLVLWPETAMPFYLQEPRKLSAAVRRLTRDLQTPLLTGAPGYEKINARDYLLYNRAYLIDTQGDISAVYDKEHLVPFGEYVPYGDKIPFINKLVAGMGDFTPGEHTAPLLSGRLALGVLICYEAIFPELAQSRVSQGANVLVNISNDAWYGRSSASAQHLALALLRAVEQHRSLVRATNTGISAIIDPRGRLLDQVGLFQARSVAAEVGLFSETTPFHRVQPYMAPLLGGCAALLFLLGLVLQRPKAPAQGTIQ